MTTNARRVALLARPGLACDRLRGALADAGVDLVLEADPLTLDPATLDTAGAQVVLVALDTQTEEALDRFEAALQNPAIEFIFEEAELAARREGWEAARWGRHLAAKLHRHGDVLPPGSEPTGAPTATDDNAPSRAAGPALDFGFEADALTGFPSADTSGPVPAAVGTMYAFDPLFAEISFDESASSVGVDSALSDTSAAFDPGVDVSYDGDFDPFYAGVSAAVSVDGVVVSEFVALSGDEDDLCVDPLSLDELRGGNLDAQDLGFDRMFDGDFAATSATATDAAGADVDGAVDAAKSVRGAHKRVLELVSTDDDPSLRGDADRAAADHRFKHDLASLESRIAGMELVDDRIIKGPEQANGAVLVMAGIGGPDAVRQLLGALPEDFPRPVLVQQRLDGGRYDKLVAQMQRATAMRVKLAEPGLPAIAGVIYILPAGVCIKVEEAGIQFTDGGDDVLAALPSADSAVLLLSGSDPMLVDAVMNHSWAGALVIGQAPDGCYDAAAPNALLARGGGSGQPAELAERLSERWRS